MATLTRGHKPDHPDIKGRCMFCEQRSEAFWNGVNGNLEVCSACALDILPALMADAVPYPTLLHFNSAIQRMQLRYWRAMTLRLVRERDRLKTGEVE